MGGHRVVRGIQRGELARRAGCNLETVRYYERIGLLPEPPRSAGGHRLYAEDHLKRLIFIRRSRELGFTVEEIRNLLGLVEDGYTCGKVRDATQAHLQIIRGKIADLRRMEQTLTQMTAQCEGGAAAECPIVDTLSEARS